MGIITAYCFRLLCMSKWDKKLPSLFPMRPQSKTSFQHPGAGDGILLENFTNTLAADIPDADVAMSPVAMGLLPDTQNCGLRIRRECRECFPATDFKGNYYLRHARAVMHVGIANPRWRAKRSRHYRRMRKPQFYISGKRPKVIALKNIIGPSFCDDSCQLLVPAQSQFCKMVKSLIQIP